MSILNTKGIILYYSLHNINLLKVVLQILSEIDVINYEMNYKLATPITLH